MNSKTITIQKIKMKTSHLKMNKYQEKRRK